MTEGTLWLSPAAAAFSHQGAVYIYQDEVGYLLEMSPDILDLLWAFEGGAESAKICERFSEAFGEHAPETFVGILVQHRCLLTGDPADLDPYGDLGGWVPTSPKWNVWRNLETGGLEFVTAWREEPPERHVLSAEEAAIWRAIDGEKSMDDLTAEFGREAVITLCRRLVHHRIQALRLSQVPGRFYEGRQHARPPYLSSTMPYRPFAPGDGPLEPPPTERTSLGRYHREQITDPQEQFDHTETTLAHLLRRHHPALDGRTYGEALIGGLIDRELLADGPLRVLEIGGGLGVMAAACVDALSERGVEIQWDILELSPALAQAQREAAGDRPITVYPGDALEDPWPQAVYDLVVANEMIGDLPASRLTHEQAGLGEDGPSGDAHTEHLKGQGPGGETIARYQIPIGDAPDPFWLNDGAVRLLERIEEHLAPGGAAVLTEFGELGRWPILSTHLDHPEVSIHFGHLVWVAHKLGLETDVPFVMDLIGLRRDLEGLAWTRSYRRALRFMLAEAGVELETVGYTREMFEDLVGDKLEPGSFGQLYYEKIEDRLGGLVPHEFKALLLRKPPGRTQSRRP